MGAQQGQRGEGEGACSCLPLSGAFSLCCCCRCGLQLPAFKQIISSTVQMFFSEDFSVSEKYFGFHRGCTCRSVWPCGRLHSFISRDLYVVPQEYLLGGCSSKASSEGVIIPGLQVEKLGVTCPGSRSCSTLSV